MNHELSLGCVGVLYAWRSFAQVTNFSSTQVGQFCITKHAATSPIARKKYKREPEQLPENKNRAGL
jgi:hypothetical protein